MEAGFCGGFVAQYIMAATVDTLVPRPTVAVFFLFSFLPKQVQFQRIQLLLLTLILLSFMQICRIVHVRPYACSSVLSHHVGAASMSE